MVAKGYIAPHTGAAGQLCPAVPFADWIKTKTCPLLRVAHKRDDRAKKTAGVQCYPANGKAIGNGKPRGDRKAFPLRAAMPNLSLLPTWLKTLCHLSGYQVLP